MLGTRKLIRVFLASPGDLADERRAAKIAVDDFNALWADQLGYHIELVGWEDTVSGVGRPQALINRDLEQCELFIGILWKRWGTPPDKSGKYTSGFEEEYSRSLRRRTKHKTPEISLYFKDVSPELLRDPGEDLKKVLAFKQRVISEKQLLFETFSDSQQFEKKVTRRIASFVQQLKETEREKAAEQSQTPTRGGDTARALTRGKSG